MSKAVMSKLRNGRPCRCSMVEGEGVSAILNEDNIKKLLKAARARLGKKATLALSGGEIEENKVKGTGIMSGGRVKIGKALKSIVSSKPAQALKEKAKKEVTKKIQEVAEEKMEEAGVPAPIARAIAKKGSKMAVDKADKKISGGATFRRGKHGKMTAEPSRRELSHNEMMLKGIELPAVKGGAIGSRSRVESVGHPGTLLGRHYSHASQAMDANFHQRFQLGPLVSGAGLYSSEGRGIY